MPEKVRNNPKDYVKLAHDFTDAERKAYGIFMVNSSYSVHRSDFIPHPQSRILALFCEGKVIGRLRYSIDPDDPLQLIKTNRSRRFLEKYGSTHLPALELILHARKLDSLKKIDVAALSESGQRMLSRLEKSGMINIAPAGYDFRGDKAYTLTFAEKGKGLEPKLPFRR